VQSAEVPDKVEPMEPEAEPDIETSMLIRGLRTDQDRVAKSQETPTKALNEQI